MRRPKAPRVPEKVEQAHIVALLRSLGAAVYVLGHPSPSDGRKFRGTGQTAGLPDLYAFLPKRVAGDSVYSVWVEVKAAGGRLRPEQRTFRDLCINSGHAHIVGGLDAVIAWLAGAGYLRADQVAHYRQPTEAA